VFFSTILFVQQTRKGKRRVSQPSSRTYLFVFGVGTKYPLEERRVLLRSDRGDRQNSSRGLKLGKSNANLA